MSQKEIECPSGLKGLIRGIKVKEENLMADREVQKSGLAIDRIVQSCWIETIDYGPYSETEKGLNWDDLLQGDKLFIFIQIRVLSYGDDYEFNAVCENCEEKNELICSINEDFKIKTLSEEDRECFKNGNRFHIKGPNGEDIEFKLIQSRDEQKMSRMMKSKATKAELVTFAFLSRIISIDGKPPKRNWIEDLDSMDARNIRREFEKHDCGVETTYKFICNSCGENSEVEFPMGKNFLKIA